MEKMRKLHEEEMKWKTVNIGYAVVDNFLRCISFTFLTDKQDEVEIVVKTFFRAELDGIYESLF